MSGVSCVSGFWGSRKAGRGLGSQCPLNLPAPGLAPLPSPVLLQPASRPHPAQSRACQHVRAHQLTVLLFSPISPALSSPRPAVGATLSGGVAAISGKFSSLMKEHAAPASGDGVNHKTWHGLLQGDLQDPWLFAYSCCCPCLAWGDISAAAPFEGSPLEDKCTSICCCYRLMCCHSQCDKCCFPAPCLVPCCSLTPRAWLWGACGNAPAPCLRSQLAKAYGIKDPYDSLVCCFFLHYVYMGQHQSRVQQLYEIKCVALLVLCCAVLCCVCSSSRGALPRWRFSPYAPSHTHAPPPSRLQVPQPQQCDRGHARAAAHEVRSPKGSSRRARALRPPPHSATFGARAG